MSRTRFTQQTSTSVPVSGRAGARSAPWPQLSHSAAFTGVMQTLLEGSGWTAIRLAMDFAMLALALALALEGLSVTAARAPLLLLPPLVMALFLLRGLYRRRLRPTILDAVIPVLSAVSVASMTVATISFFLNGQIPSQSVWVRAWVFSLVGAGAGRIALAATKRWARSRRLIGKPVLIVGAGIVGSQVARRLEDHPEYGLVPVGFIDDDPRSTAEVGGRDAPVVGTLEQVDQIIERTHVQQLIVAFSSVADARISRLIQHSQELGVDVAVVPRMFDTMNDRAVYDNVGGLPLLNFSVVDPKGWQFAIKYAFDRIVAMLLLVVFSPLMAAIAIAVRLNSPGPVFFRQRRVGRDGTVFDLLKFRSMRMPAVRAIASPKPIGNVAGELVAAGPMSDSSSSLLPRNIAPGGVEGADRRTVIGRILRRSSMDELPQLLNVLKGDMSIIGPRPERPEFVELFDQDITRYGDRHRVKSGITGWAQVHGLRGQTSLAERVELDNYYIAHWSLGLDMKIALMTLTAVFRNAE
jgi:exopolysaccharide biosynthesis polyprenyl glycosylphosphotransferase